MPIVLGKLIFRTVDSSESVRVLVGPAGGPPEPSVAYTLTDPWDLLNVLVAAKGRVISHAHVALLD